MNIRSYILTYNSPKQLALGLDKMKVFQPEFFHLTSIKVCDQSNISDCLIENKSICESFSIEHWTPGNYGCTGGRIKCAIDFGNSNFDFMFYFEDDITFNEKSELRNRFGFPYYVSNVCQKSLEIMEFENLDYLKLNFEEAATDHTIYWPKELAPDLYSKFTKMHYINIGYLLGEIFFCNWPHCISKHGHNLIFLNELFSKGEYTIVEKSHKLIDEKILRAGILMASPLRHFRTFDYNRETRTDMVHENLFPKMENE